MKFTEALQKCYETPGKIYTRKYLASLVERFVFMKYNGTHLVFSIDGKNYDFIQIETKDIESDWQPVLQKVTWQEALEAWLFGDKKVKWVYISGENMTVEYYNTKNKSIPINHIMDGKWYILED